jgi:hypothetical protein
MQSGYKTIQLINLQKLTNNCKRFNSSLQVFVNHVNNELELIKAAGTYKTERIIVTKQGSHIKVAGNNNQILNFCANNYLGLSVRLKNLNNFLYPICNIFLLESP